MTRSKTKRMKEALQGLILKINEKEDQCELRVAPNWVTFLQINEDVLRPTLTQKHRSSAFGMRTTKEGLLPLANSPLSKNSPMNHMTSSFKVSQKDFMNLKLKPSDPRLLWFPHFCTTSFSSSSLKIELKKLLCS